MAPTIHRERGYRFFFFSLEESRIHVHVYCADGEAKYWLEPQVELARNYRMSRKQLREAKEIVEGHLDEFKPILRFPVSAEPMSSKDEDLRSEYPADLIKSGVRGKYAKRYREEGTNLVLIDPDLQKFFPDSEAVNRALRDYVDKRKERAT